MLGARLQEWASRLAQLPSELQGRVLHAAEPGTWPRLRSVCRAWRQRLDAAVASARVCRGSGPIAQPQVRAGRSVLSRMRGLTALHVERLDAWVSAACCTPWQVLPHAVDRTQLRSLSLSLRSLREEALRGLGVLQALSQLQALTQLQLLQADDSEEGQSGSGGGHAGSSSASSGGSSTSQAFTLPSSGGTARCACR